MISHGNIVSNINNSKLRSPLSPNVGLRLVLQVIRSTPTADRRCTTTKNTRLPCQDINVLLFWIQFILFPPIDGARYLHHPQ